jgi:hypothetical protein
VGSVGPHVVEMAKCMGWPPRIVLLMKDLRFA